MTTLIEKRYREKGTPMREIKSAIQRVIRYEDEVALTVKVYDVCESDNDQIYDVEVQWAIGEDTYTDCLVADSYYSNVRGDEVSLKEATKRAKAVLKIVKGWYEYYEEVTVTNEVEVYS